ncbi:MAG: hypothetical protein ABI625_19440 [bacterium]
MFATPEALAHFVKPWAKFHNHSKVAATLATFLHIAPIVVGGGFGIFLDRATLRVKHDDPHASERHLLELRAVHPYVISALALSFVSGIALLAADLDTFLGSIVFWIKMGLVLLLLANGVFMQRLEHALGRVAEGTVNGASVLRAATLWDRLRLVAIVSLLLWLTITFTGVALVNVS